MCCILVGHNEFCLNFWVKNYLASYDVALDLYILY